MKMPYISVALCAVALLSSCARDTEGHILGPVGQWKAMREKQDADARNFVNTDRDQEAPNTSEQPVQSELSDRAALSGSGL